MRLAHGGLIDRGPSLRFSFDGRRYTGRPGDTLASALLANGVRLTGRSFKYHRPRGIQGAGFEEPATLVQLSGDEDAANLPVTRVALRDGLVARSVNCWPSAAFDLGALAQAFAALLPAGFYYKTFMWPNWHWFEPFIRRAAGLGRAPASAAPLDYETRYEHCDVLVVGAGPAGLMAALAAGTGGARVLLVDDDRLPGGRLNGEAREIDGRPAHEWAAGIVERLDAMRNVVRLADATAWAYHEHNFLLVTERSPAPAHVFQRTRRVRATQVVLATGAIERPLVFAGNDRPGVMLAGAASTYVNRYAVRPGRRAVVFTNNDSAYRTALDLARNGVEVAAVADVREHVGATQIEQLRDERIELLAGWQVTRAHGPRTLRGVSVRDPGGTTRRIACDLLCVSGGWNPAVHLFSQARGELRYDETTCAFVPAAGNEANRSAGAANGVFDLAACLREGLEAGVAAARAAGFDAADVPVPRVDGTGAETPLQACWYVEAHGGTLHAFVDVQNDVTLDDLGLARREGYGAIEHLKRYTTTGMGVDQGKTGNVNAIGAIAQQTGQTLPGVGTTTFRPPYVPVEFGAIVGRRRGTEFLPYRHTPMTAWHKARGAVMYEAGARWRRPGYYPLPGEGFQAAVDRECTAVRETLGMYDGSPLGKFEIAGRNALDLLELVYTNNWRNLAPGNARYGLMLTDAGLILDDGVCCRLGEHRYLMSTSTVNADEVYRHVEHLLRLERPEWEAWVTPVTARWANATVCGPLAREALRAAGTDIDLDPHAFPFMSLREGTVAGLPARVFRVSFTGELSFEVNVPARYGLALWEALMKAGEAFGITPVGSEASHVLRVEKGFLSLGHEVDGTADPFDLGLGWAMSRSKPDFIGKRSVEIRRASGRPRRELVGLLPEDPREMLAEGAPITPGGLRRASEGFVSACVWSVVRKRTVALGLLLDGRQRLGEWVHVRAKERVLKAQVTEPVFHDPDGTRMRG